MKKFRFRLRPFQNETQIPQVGVGIVHLVGAGRLRVEKEHFVFEANGKRQLRIDADGLTEIIAYDEVSATTSAMRLAHQRGVMISWCSRHGTFLVGRFAVETADRSLTRLLQYNAWEDALWQRSLAREIVAEKIESVRAATRHYQRQGKPIEKNAIAQLDQAIEATGSAAVDQLRGIEGRVAAAWYGRMGKWLPKPWSMAGRTRRPPRDPVNALLSLGYMHLYRRCVARIEAAGFEPALGALHEFRPGRMSMACDIMEPLRIPVVDRFVLALIARRMVRVTDFQTDASDRGVRLNSDKLGDVLGRLEEHWHQGLFAQHLDVAMKRWSGSIRERVSEKTSRASAYLKRQAMKNARGSGNSEPYAP